MNDIEIEEFIENLTDECKNGNYIFRGMREIYDNRNQKDKEVISSTLYRKYLEHKDFWNEHFKPADSEKEIVEKTRIQLEQYNNSTNIEILTDLRHYGAAVTIIDFSLDIYTALFFACNGEFDEPGELAMLEISEIPHIKDVNYENPTFGIVEPAQTETGQNRATGQNSIFVCAPNGFIPKDSCIIKEIEAEDKKSILNYLKECHSITQNNIYNDLIGFIDNEENYTSNQVEFYKGLSCDNSGDTKGAIAHYTKSIDLNPNLLNTYVNRGGAKGELRDYEGAIEDFDKAIELNLNDAETYTNRSTAKYKIGNHKEAIEDYTKAIELKPDYAEAYLGRGTVKIQTGYHKEAIEDYTKAIELKPDYAEAYGTRGVPKYELGYPKEAIEDYTKAIELKPDYAEAYGNRAVAKYGLGNHEEAIEDFNKAIELDPDDAQVYINRGLAKHGLGNHEEAIKDYDKAIELDSNFADAYFNRGSAKCVLGNYGDGIKDFNKAIELDPDDIEAYLKRGNTQCVLGRYENGIKDYNKAIELDPNFAKRLRPFIKAAEEEIRKATEEQNKA